MEIPHFYLPKTFLSVVAAGSIVVACNRDQTSQAIRDAVNETVDHSPTTTATEKQPFANTFDFCVDLERRDDVPIENAGHEVRSTSTTRLEGGKIIIERSRAQNFRMFRKGIEVTLMSGEKAIFECTWENLETKPQTELRIEDFSGMDVEVKDQHRKGVSTIYADGAAGGLCGRSKEDFDGILDGVCVVNDLTDRVEKHLHYEQIGFQTLVEEGLTALNRGAYRHYSIEQHNADYDAARRGE